MSVESLITLLQKIEACDEIHQIVPDSILDEEYGGYQEEDLHPLIQEALSIANGELITSTGGCNWAAHDKLEAAGFRVKAGDKDSFGWLTGLICTKKGTIMYG